MSEHPEGERDRDEQEPARKPYAPPRLVRHGTIDELTRGALATGRPGDPLSSFP